MHGAVYGESGNVGGSGGDALYVNNEYTQRYVEIRSYGKIWLVEVEELLAIWQ